MKKKFLEFLKRENVYEKFETNLLRSRKMDFETYMSHASREFHQPYKIYLVIQAFSWKGSAEGFEFWYKVDSKWLSFIHYKNKGGIL